MVIGNQFQLLLKENISNSAKLTLADKALMKFEDGRLFINLDVEGK